MSTAVLEQPQETSSSDDDGHIACYCSPCITFCGAYDPRGITEERPISEDDCAACVELWATGPCPRCGCRQEEDWCDKCKAGAAR